SENSIPAIPQADDSRFEKDRLIVFQQIKLNDEKIGTFYIESDLSDIHALVWRLVYAFIGILLGSLMVSFLLSSKLQRLVSEPILQLSRVAKKVSEEKDYSVRAIKSTRDELGTLID